jgi:hypothetical protein
VTASDKFYNGLADQLVGLRTKELSAIKEKLQEIGKLTPNGTFSYKGENLKKRLDAASDLLNDIQTTINKVQSNDLEKIEVEAVKLDEEKQNNDNRINLLEDARKREKFQKGKDALSKIRNDQQSLKGLVPFNKNDEENWRFAEKQIDLLKPQREKMAQELQSLKSECDVGEKSIETEQNQFRILQASKEKLTHELKPEIAKFEKGRADAIQQETKGKFFTNLG